MGTVTIIDPVWTSEIILPNPFRCIILQPWVVSSHVWIDKYLEGLREPSTYL